MAGIAGLFRFRGDPPSYPAAARMADRLAHRGHRANQQLIDGPAVIIQRTHQEATLRSHADHVVLLDGWISETEHLASSLGCAPDTDSHTLIAEAWFQWGPDALHHLDGDFALAIWARRSRTLYLARDRMGVRPLFWARHGNRFAFASELPALLHAPFVSRTVHRERLAEYLSFQVVHAPNTLLRDVHQLEPGTWLKVNADRLRTTTYWTPRYSAPTTQEPPATEVIDSLQHAVRAAVKRRVPANRSVGLMLSGGLGSTAIAAEARGLQLTLPSFTLSFADDPYPESPFAGRVAALLGLEHTEIQVGTKELADHFEPTVWALGHPTGNPAQILQLCLLKTASQSVDIALSGDGGEELFGGRMLDGLSRSLNLARRVQKLPTFARSGLARLLAGQDRGRRLTTPPERYALDLGIGGTRLFDTDARRALFRDPRWTRPQVRQEILGRFYRGLDTDPVNVALHGFVRSWLAEGSLVRADRTAAAAGIELRFPLLDRDVVERAAQLPGSMKIKRRGSALHTRWPLKAMLTGILPPPLVNRPKRGMPTPLSSWLVGPGRLFLEDRFAKLQADPLQLWDPETLLQLKRRLSKDPKAGVQVWSLLLLDAWLCGIRAS